LSTYRAASLFEFLMLSHGILAINADFTISNIDIFIATACEDWCRWFIVLVCAIMCFFFPFSTMYFVYDFHKNNNNNNDNNNNNLNANNQLRSMKNQDLTPRKLVKAPI